MSVEEDGSAAFGSPEGSENACCSVSFSFTSFPDSSKTVNHGITALKYAFSRVFCSLEKGQELLRVLLSAASSWMERSGTLQLCWEASQGLDVNFEGEEELPTETVQQLGSYFGVGDLTCQVVVQQLMQIFFGEVYEESFVCWGVLFCFVFNILHKPAPMGAVAPPTAPHLEASL